MNLEVKWAFYAIVNRPSTFYGKGEGKIMLNFINQIVLNLK